MHLHLTRSTTAAASPNVLAVAGMFGLGIDERRPHTIIAPTDLSLPDRGVVFVTGPSGSGKSSILHAIAGHRPDALRFDALADLPDAALVDCFPGAALTDVLRWLSLAGLADAFVLLRKPAELSDGQRYRLRLAQVMSICESSDRGRLVLADEFAATLDRITAMVLARNVRRWVDRHGRVCFVAATTHDDLLEPLRPDVLIEKHLDGGLEIVRREAAR